MSAPDPQSARENPRYLALSRILSVGATPRLRYRPGLKLLGYFLDDDVYPQAAPEAVAQAISAFRRLIVIGALILGAALVMLLIL